MLLIIHFLGKAQQRLLKGRTSENILKAHPYRSVLLFSLATGICTPGLGHRGPFFFFFFLGGGFFCTGSGSLAGVTPVLLLRS